LGIFQPGKIYGPRGCKMTPADHSLENRRFMYLGYVDDSGSTGNNLDDGQAPFQVIGGPIIDEESYPPIQTILAINIEELVPPEQWDSFEFHAVDLFHARKPFDVLGQEKCWSLLATALGCVRKFKLPVLYGAIDKENLKSKIFRTAKPVDMAFRLYLQALEEWFEAIYDPAKQVDHASWPHALVIADDSRKDMRNDLERGFRDAVKKGKAGQWPKGLGLNVFDDLYFGNSKNSIGLQLADICVYVVARHLAQKPDAKGFYDIISTQVFNPKIFPEGLGKGGGCQCPQLLRRSGLPLKRTKRLLLAWR
jgi:hypothetical protein